MFVFNSLLVSIYSYTGIYRYDLYSMFLTKTVRSAIQAGSPIDIGKGDTILIDLDETEIFICM